MSWPSRVTLLYALICGLSFVTAYFALNRFEARRLQAIQGSTLFYASRDPASSVLAARIRGQLKIRTVDLLTPGAGAMLHRLTGARKAESPTLVLAENGSMTTASGTSAVEQVLLPVTNGVTPARLAKRALLGMAGLILLALVFAVEISAVVSFLPIVGLVALSMLWGSCLNCGSSSSKLSALAPLLGLGYLAAGIALFTLPVVRSRSVHTGFLLVSGLIPSIQAYLLVVEPKLCPACLAVTFVSAAYFVITSRTLASSELSGIASPLWASSLLIASLGLLTIRHSLVLGGYVSLGQPLEVEVPRINGNLLSKFVPSVSSPQRGALYLVTQEFCGACKTAEHDLDQMKIPWRKLPVCTMLTNDGCFDGRGLAFPTPMLLICDQSGRITFQRNGWVSSPDQLDTLRDQIQIAQRGVAMKK